MRAYPLGGYRAVGRSGSIGRALLRDGHGVPFGVVSQLPKWESPDDIQASDTERQRERGRGGVRQ
ncbi:hypothetical protein GCM10023147_27320 [Tsukamurella soli]|uniref:Uncharacterized protein n=1 Tax=Tsukamurella soli TaxID=644556 RepID=A0ABP8JR79_9ACTN